MKLRAEILSKLYYDPEKVWGVYEARDIETGVVQSLVGKLPELIPGEIVEGEVVLNERRNAYTGFTETQWKVKSALIPSPPVTPDGMRAFLGGGFAFRVGPSVAGNMVDTYGRNTLNILEQMESDIESYVKRTGETLPADPEELSVAMAGLAKAKRSAYLFAPLKKIPGVGNKIAAYIMTGWVNNKARHDLMLFLFSCGLSSAMIGRVIKELGSNAKEILRENPYELLRIIPSVPFRVPDSIAREGGMSPNDDRRLFAMFSHVMNSIIFQFGHICAPEYILQRETAKFAEKTGWAVAPEELISAPDRMIAAQLLADSFHGGTRYIYTPQILRAEKESAAGIRSLLRETPHRALTTKFVLGAMDKWERKNKVQLDEVQRQALLTCLGSSISILTGGPGTGKTTIMRCARAILDEAELDVVECAPTGKAARNMSEDASTIHRLLELTPDDEQDGYMRGVPVKSDYVFVDESSMMDGPLGAAVIGAIHAGSARVVFVGDADQLPPVGPGAVLRDMIDSGEIPVSRLSSVYRTKQGGILDFLHSLRNAPKNEGASIKVDWLAERNLPSRLDLSSGNEVFGLFDRGDGAGVADGVMEAVKGLVKSGRSPLDIQVMAPMKRGEAGVRALNERLQKLLNPNSHSKDWCMETVSFGETVLWAPDDRVINVKNDYQNNVFNGEIGYVKSVDKGTRAVTVIYPELNNQTVRYERDSLDSLLHAYAITIHKSQGSEYKLAVIALPKESRIMAERALLYTAASRARERCVIVGDRDTVNLAATTVKNRRRVSLLRERIAGEEISETTPQVARGACLSR